MSVIKYKDSNGNYVKIPANVGINNVVEGYYNEIDSKFYEESTYETEITGEANKIYISLDTDKSYYWDGSEYKLLSGGGGVSDFDELLNRPRESDTIDIDDLDLPMPAKPTEYPILFDETGTEYKVGYYKRASDGKVKPIYVRTVIIKIATTSGNTTVNNAVPDVDIMLSMYGCYFENYQNGQYYSVPNLTSGYQAGLKYYKGSGNLMLALNTASEANNQNAYITCRYTKTTDEFRDL